MVQYTNPRNMEGELNIHKGDEYTSFGVVNEEEIIKVLNFYEAYCAKDNDTMAKIMPDLPGIITNFDKTKSPIPKDKYTFSGTSLTCGETCAPPSGTRPVSARPVSASGGKKRKSKKK